MLFVNSERRFVISSFFVLNSLEGGREREGGRGEEEVQWQSSESVM